MVESESENPKSPEEESEDDDVDCDQEEEEEDAQVECEDGGSQPEEVQSYEKSYSGVEMRESRLETLTVACKVKESDRFPGLKVNSTLELLKGVEFKDKVRLYNQDITAQAAESRKQNQNLLQSFACATSSSELSPTSSALSPTQIEQRPSLGNVNNLCMPESNHQNSSEVKATSSAVIVRTSASDGFNWRKYGQKLVKSPEGSRSYYRCTNIECSAKRIACCDHSGCVIEMVYKGGHNHDPPLKISCRRERRHASRAVPVVQDIVTEHPIRTSNDSDLSITSKEPVQETCPAPERKRQNTIGSEGNGESKVKEELFNKSEPKRVKKSNFACSSSLLKPGKKPKVVVHAAGDEGISGDGYRWRKYGQKMVKGKPHPRNYYRCTSAGCPARKHIETAIDNTSAVIITYTGVHDHDTPVPKKRHGAPTAPLVAAASPASMNNNKSEAFQTHISSTQWSSDKQGEMTGEKVVESARTLLSIGFEIKPI